jgi:hypothetical protein
MTMNKMFTRAASVLLAAASLVTAVSAPASASVWHSNLGAGGYTGGFTAAAGALTLGGPAAAMTCTSTTVIGALTGSSSTAASWTGVMTGNVTGGGCWIGSQVAFPCSSSFDANAYFGPIPPPGGVTVGVLNVTCVVRQFGLAVCDVTGALPASYTNPMVGTHGYFSIPLVSSASGVLRVAAVSGRTCPLGTGNASLTAITETLTSTAPDPIVWRAAI